MLCRPASHCSMLLFAIAIALPTAQAAPVAAQTMSASTAYHRAKAGRLLLIDVRTPSEWAKTGSPRHARRLMATQPRSAFLARVARMTGGNRSKPIAVICAKGVRSSEMRETLDLAGYQHVVDVAEGMLGSSAGPGWLARRLPVDRVRSAAAD